MKSTRVLITTALAGALLLAPVPAFAESTHSAPTSSTLRPESSGAVLRIGPTVPECKMKNQRRFTGFIIETWTYTGVSNRRLVFDYVWNNIRSGERYFQVVTCR